MGGWVGDGPSGSQPAGYLLCKAWAEDKAHLRYTHKAATSHTIDQPLMQRI